MAAGSDRLGSSPLRRPASVTRTARANHARPARSRPPAAARIVDSPRTSQPLLLLLLTQLLAACSSSAPSPDTAADTAAVAPGVRPADTPADARPDSVMARDTFFDGSETVWLDAEGRGVTFRAVGQEPGWLLEMGAEGNIRLVTDYGAEERILPMPAPVVDSVTWTTTYRVVAPDVDLTIDIRDEPCADTMSGERFPATVTVVLNRMRYSGCGRTLDLLP
ncbi:MAG TPA: hypothetical protein VK933_09725 [Longimicrobiales bacterium]|nr:hypothetical protein [Longimicrobiales bacterium]